jgi:hypothetical protein
MPGATGGLNESELEHCAPGAGAQTRPLDGGIAGDVVRGADPIGAPNVLGVVLVVAPSAVHAATTKEPTTAPTH